MRFRVYKIDENFEDEIVQKVYSEFRLVWNKEYQVIDNVSLLNSDKFFQFDELLCLEDEGEILAAIFTQKMDLRSNFCIEHSFFLEWPKKVLDSLKESTPKLSILTHLLVPEKHRKTTTNNDSYAYLLLALSMLHFTESDDQIWIAALRNNRGVNKLCESVGSVLIENVELRNLDVDLVKYTREQVAVKAETYPELVFNLHKGAKDERGRSKSVLSRRIKRPA